MAKCPICKVPVNKGNKDFPFCSERCKTIDLGSWAAEKYRMPSAAPVPEEEMEEEFRKKLKKDWEQ